MATKVAADVAEAEFERFLATMDLDAEHVWDTQEDECRVILRAMEAGTLVLNDDGEPVFTPSEGDAITFAEPRGRHRSQMSKQSDAIKKSFALIAGITQQPPKRFEDMRQRDLKVVEAVVMLFLVG